MLLVNAKKGPSGIHGFGLFAHEFIRKKTRIWKFQKGFDVAMSPPDLAQLSPYAREQMIYYAYYDPRSRLYIMSSDDDRFTNHSEKPNVVLDEDGDSTIACCDINIGEEITWDYRPWCGWHIEPSTSNLLPHEYLHDEAISGNL